MRRDLGEALIWLVAAALAAAAVAWAYPRAMPLIDPGLPLGRGEIRTIALERLRQLGPPVDDPYLVVRLSTDGDLGRRLQLAAPEVGVERLRRSRLAETLVSWQVLVYPPAVPRGDWSYFARLTRSGEVLTLLRRIPDDEAGTTAPDDDEAHRQAWAFLAAHGLDLDALEPAPQARRVAQGDRVDLTLRYPFREALLGPGVTYGVEVPFRGGRIAGFRRFDDDPQAAAIQGDLQALALWGFGGLLAGVLLLSIVAVPFLKLYHDGQLGVRRGLQILLLCAGAGLITMALIGRAQAENVGSDLVTRQQMTWLGGSIVYIFVFLVPAGLAMVAWSVGEWHCRARWPQKLAAVDALFRLRWQNATVARSSLRGLAGGLVVVALQLAIALAAMPRAWLPATSGYGDVLGSALPALGWLAGAVAAVVPFALVAYLLVPAWAGRRLGRRWGFVVALVVALLLARPDLVLLPLPWTLPVAFVGALVPLLLVYAGDLLAALLAALAQSLIPAALPALYAADAGYQINGWLALLALAAPLLASIRYLGSGEEFRYTYDDVPPHVRRIAERERQRVELETARGIQQSILPELPPQLQGVEIAHSYLPATEVGGDFYDVLALDDGRLAVAVGDVAGHGVSSGLVMSMTKSALAVQVTFDPAVESVMGTLNRMVYQSARARLLTTLCYAVLDPRRREMLYASAGHLFPYRLRAGGEVEHLEAGAYPLGVRGDIAPRVRNVKLAPGDVIFLYSDGLVEACADGSDEPFGFERLEASLRRHAGESPQRLRDAVLADVARYAGARARQDDVTVLVLRLPD
ncbi:MAG: hypothetical protein D6696_09500 [Acidobacteria bacterium]|nr:MAG: hypothetical protein D6696_09500 [Acidobacteriota bacterium]